VEWDGKRLPVVDMHLHPGDWDHIPEDTRKFLASRFPFPLGVDAESSARDAISPESILSELDNAGIWGGGLFAIYAPRTVGVASNELVAESLAYSRDRYYGFASLRVDRWNIDRDAEICLDGCFRIRKKFAADPTLNFASALPYHCDASFRTPFSALAMPFFRISRRSNERRVPRRAGPFATNGHLGRPLGSAWRFRIQSVWT
jgi:hypothetical protein